MNEAKAGTTFADDARRDCRLDVAQAQVQLHAYAIDAAATAGWTAVYNSDEPQPAVSPRSLRGLTVFITGASRGIGLAIALRAAADGANIVIAAKSETEDPRIPGTIYSAAKEVEAAGGRALPIAVDIRSEIAVEAAVARAVAHFGGIDILINNASAISLTPTPDTSMKRYDLMHSVNARGTFMVTQKCLPHLQKSRHAHVLNISPPLNMETKWFAPHVAYTMAKYGMSMCVLGMAAELADSSIAVNALWPRTAIDTAAVKNLLGGGEVVRYSRLPTIMADSAWLVLTRKPKTCSGNFFIDDEVLASEGVTDLRKYNVDSAVSQHELQPDFFC